MIPLRIFMTGFLSYRTEQTLDFADMPLCMLSGPNGSGKSSVFDALTFALFGEHRSGMQHNEDLINKKTDTAAIELEFLCNGITYSIRRTVQRKPDGSAKPVTSVLRRKDGKLGTWDVVPDTATRETLKAWVENNVGLTAATFTSSTLLRQGKADRLLTSKPAERSELLAAAVGLEQYKQLHGLADDQRKKRKGGVETLRAQLDGEPVVSEEQVAAASRIADGARATLAKADSEVARLQPLLEKSRNWKEWSSRLNQAQCERQQYDLIIARQQKIEADCGRLRQLRPVIVSLRSIVDHRGRLAESLKTFDLLRTRRAECDASRTALETSVVAQRESWQKLSAQIESKNQELRAAENRLAGLAGILSQAEERERQEAELAAKKKERARFPADAAEKYTEAKKEEDRLVELTSALGMLRRFDGDRRIGIEARDKVKLAGEGAAHAKRELDEALLSIRTLKQQIDTSDYVVSKAQADDARVSAELKQIRKELAELEKIDGLPECPTCGQPLDAEHGTKEKARRRKNEKDAMAASAAAAQALREAQESRKKLLTSKTAVDDQRARVEVRLRTLEQSARTSGDDLHRRLKECAQSYEALPETFRREIGSLATDRQITADDWLATTWPTGADLDEFAQDLVKLPQAKIAATSAESAWDACRQLDAEVKAIERVLTGASSDRPVAVVPLRGEQTQLTATQQKLTASLAAERAELRRQDQAVKTTEGDISKETSSGATLDGELKKEEALQAGNREAIATATAALPAAWVLSADTVDATSIKKLDAEQKTLETANAEGEFELLQAAKAKIAALDQRIESLKKDLAALPAEAQADPAGVNGKLHAAQASQQRCRDDLNVATSTHLSLTNRRQRRCAIEVQYQTAEREHGHYKRVSEMLGREQLQRHLMRKAEREIVQFANAILDRISGGDLMLRLRPADQTDPTEAGDAGSERVLDLQAFNRRTGASDAINTAFLSGSQQFRVAVSLALAFGQYAGGSNRLGECVIIDEGFGSLDRQGQEVMIEALRDLQKIMKRIILVSHQESFAEAFSHGYHFVLEDGETRITRLST